MILYDLHPVWQAEQHKDIPMTPEQYQTFCKGYNADWECRYEPISLGDGWHYIYRSGYLLKKFRYQLCDDGLYHLKEHFTTEKEKGRNLLEEVLLDGYFEPRLTDIITWTPQRLKSRDTMQEE